MPVRDSAIHIPDGLPETLPESLLDDASCRAESEKHILLHGVLYAPCLPLSPNIGQGAALHRLSIRFKVFGIPEPDTFRLRLRKNQRGRADPESQVWMFCPVTEIVPALMPRQGVVADLIPAKAALPEEIACFIVHAPLRILIRKIRQKGKRRGSRNFLSFPVTGIVRRPRLHNETVDRKMRKPALTRNAD